NRRMRRDGIPSGPQSATMPPASLDMVRFAPESGHSSLTSARPLCAVVSSGRRNTLSQTQETEWKGDGSKICSRFQRGGQRGVVEPLAVLHSQFNRVARQLNERSRETLGFETRAQRDLMLVLHRPIEPTPESRHCLKACVHAASITG